MQSNYMITACTMGGVFLMIGFLFLIAKEKACILISGYNFKSKEERKQYDEKKRSKDFRNFSFVCSAIFLFLL